MNKRKEPMVIPFTNIKVIFRDLAKEGREMAKQHEKLDLERLSKEQPIDIERIMAGEEV